jgi:hypothetical protein
MGYNTTWYFKRIIKKKTTNKLIKKRIEDLENFKWKKIYLKK